MLLQGSHVSVDSVDGVKLSGVLHTITPFDSKHVVVIKASKVEVRHAHLAEKLFIACTLKIFLYLSSYFRVMNPLPLVPTME